MDPNNRLDELELIVTLLRDIQKSHGAVFNTRALRNTTSVVRRRTRSEGLSFLTKTLPRLGKAFDKALTGSTKLNCITLGFKPYRNTELPIFMGEFFSRVFQQDGTILPDSCATCVRVIRDVCYLFYKYKLPYDTELEQKVISSFLETENDLERIIPKLQFTALLADDLTLSRRRSTKVDSSLPNVIREARILLSRVFSGFDFTDIVPRHGPGVVATKQQLWEKFRWTNVASRIRKYYPLDAYFYASLGHVCDDLDSIATITDHDLPAKVILVPKDSRGPRLISCEPVENQWIQQGIMAKLVQRIETLNLTRFNVFFTDQGPNQRGALLGSKSGRYATLDLKEASDRISLELVRLLFPKHVYDVLETVRSSATVLPDGKKIPLLKHAPMGSALCFPVLALTIWSILTAAAPNAYTRERILVYGDDVIVPTAFAANAIEQLESLGLLINRDKSCTSGFFRESCGVDAFKGINVTPLRLRTVWSSTPSASSYTSWIAYANAMYDRQYFTCYDYIVGELHRLYGPIPEESMHLACPSLREVSEPNRPQRSRINHHLQKRQWLCNDVKAPSVIHTMNGWSMLLRFFTESSARIPSTHSAEVQFRDRDFSLSADNVDDKSPFSVSTYTKRRTSMLVRRWR